MFARRIGWSLGTIGVIAGVATLLGPAERVWGVDVGATSSVAFWLSIGAAIWLLAKRGDEVFPEHMAITERRAWISVTFLALILANFVVGMMVLADHGQTPERIGDLSSRFPFRLGLLIGAWALCSGVLVREDDLDADERDLQFQQRADRAANLALNLSVVVAIGLLIWAPRNALSWWLAPLILAHVLIGVLMARALVENLVLVVSYRRA